MKNVPRMEEDRFENKSTQANKIKPQAFISPSTKSRKVCRATEPGRTAQNSGALTKLLLRQWV